MKKIICCILSITIILGVAFATTYTALTATFPIFINGQEWICDKSPVVIDGSTYLPLKSIGDALGINVAWNSKENRVEISGQIKSSFREIYEAFKENTLKAEKNYKGNRYAVTCVVNDIKTYYADVFRVDATAYYGNTRCIIECDFSKKTQQEAIENIKVGDIITFEGECYSWGMWDDCQILNVLPN